MCVCACVCMTVYEQHTSANPLVRYCHLGVSPVNYSDSDSDSEHLYIVIVFVQCM